MKNGINILPCRDCGCMPISGGNTGTFMKCPSCGKRTNEYESLEGAITAWNSELMKGMLY